MLRVRIFAAGAVLLFAATGALAQSDSPAGKPLPILKIDHQPGKTKAKPHAALRESAAKPAKIASHRKAAPKLAAVRHNNHAVVAGKQHQPAAAAAPTAENAGSIVSAAVPPTAPSASIAPPTPVAPVVLPTPGTAPIRHDLVVESQTMPLVQPNDVAAAPLPNDGIKPPTAAPGDNLAPKTDKLGDTLAAPAQRIAQAFVAAPAQRSPVGSASWIAKVFAALGGAVAAGSVAWFLIGPALPLKTES